MNGFVVDRSAQIERINFFWSQYQMSASKVNKKQFVDLVDGHIKEHAAHLSSMEQKAITAAIMRSWDNIPYTARYNEPRPLATMAKLRLGGPDKAVRNPYQPEPETLTVDKDLVDYALAGLGDLFKRMLEHPNIVETFKSIQEIPATIRGLPGWIKRKAGEKAYVVVSLLGVLALCGLGVFALKPIGASVIATETLSAGQDKPKPTKPKPTAPLPPPGTFEDARLNGAASALLSVDESTKKGQYQRATFFFRRRQYDDAKHAVSRFLETYDDEWDQGLGFFLLGMIQKGAENLDAARASLLRAADLFDNFKTNANLMRVYYHLSLISPEDRDKYLPKIIEHLETNPSFELEACVWYSKMVHEREQSPEKWLLYARKRHAAAIKTGDISLATWARLDLVVALHWNNLPNEAKSIRSKAFAGVAKAGDPFIVHYDYYCEFLESPCDQARLTGLDHIALSSDDWLLRKELERYRKHYCP